MKITEVEVKLDSHQFGNERIQAFCHAVFDNRLVIRDIRVIAGAKGLFVAFPSRKLMDRCACGGKNILTAQFCNHCGRRLEEHRAALDANGRPKLHADIAHPINHECRAEIEHAVLRAYSVAVSEAEIGVGNGLSSRVQARKAAPV